MRAAVEDEMAVHFPLRAIETRRVQRAAPGVARGRIGNVLQHRLLRDGIVLVAASLAAGRRGGMVDGGMADASLKVWPPSVVLSSEPTSMPT